MPLRRRIDQLTGVSRARTRAARSATTGRRSAATLQSAVNARYVSGNRRGAPVFSRRTGLRVGSMVKNGG